MKNFTLLFIFIYFMLGCVSKNSARKNNNDDFTFSSITSSGIVKYDSKTYIYSDNSTGKNRKVKLQLTQIEKDSLFKSYSINFNKCLVFSDNFFGKSFENIKLTYKSQKEILVCDTLDFKDDNTSKKELEFYGKLKGILSKKNNYKYTFPEEFIEL